MPVDRLTISGPTLAALLQAVHAQQLPCDGLLLGSLCTTTSTQARDTSDALVVQETIGHISSVHTCIGTHSFYSNSGQISGTALQQLLRAATTSQQQQQQAHPHQQQQQQQQHQLLGWFSYRPYSPGTPSMREVAVSNSLQAWLNSNNTARIDNSSSSSRSRGIDSEVAGISIGAAAAATMSSSGNSRPVIFALVTSQTDHNDATISLQYRFFHFGPPSSSASSNTSSRRSAGGSSSSNRVSIPIHPYLQPVDLIVHNLGSSLKSAAAPASGAVSSSGSTGGVMQIWGSSGLPTLSAVLADGSGSSGLSQQQQAELAAAAAGASAAAMAVQGVYEGLLDDLQLAAATVSTKQARLEHLQAANVALRQQVVVSAADTRREEQRLSRDAGAAHRVPLL